MRIWVQFLRPEKRSSLEPTFHNFHASIINFIKGWDLFLDRIYLFYVLPMFGLYNYLYLYHMWLFLPKLSTCSRSLLTQVSMNSKESFKSVDSKVTKYCQWSLIGLRTKLRNLCSNHNVIYGHQIKVPGLFFWKD